MVEAGGIPEEEEEGVSTMMTLAMPVDSRIYLHGWPTNWVVTATHKGRAPLAQAVLVIRRTVMTTGLNTMGVIQTIQVLIKTTAVDPCRNRTRTTRPAVITTRGGTTADSNQTPGRSKRTTKPTAKECRVVEDRNRALSKTGNHNSRGVDLM